jgi:hypothetical protein
LREASLCRETLTVAWRVGLRGVRVDEKFGEERRPLIFFLFFFNTFSISLFLFSPSLLPSGCFFQICFLYFSKQPTDLSEYLAYGGAARPRAPLTKIGRKFTSMEATSHLARGFRVS